MLHRISHRVFRNSTKVWNIQKYPTLLKYCWSRIQHLSSRCDVSATIKHAILCPIHGCLQKASYDKWKTVWVSDGIIVLRVSKIRLNKSSLLPVNTRICREKKIQTNICYNHRTTSNDYKDFILGIPNFHPKFFVRWLSKSGQ